MMDHIQMNEKHSDDTPPFPLKGMLVVCCAVFASGISFSGLFPYVGFMVMDLMRISEDEAGFYAGYIASSMMVGRCLSSYPWGVCADTYGRKPVISIGLFFAALFSVIFGLSDSMTWALLARFFLGLLNPVIGIAKTLVSEVALGVKEHEVKGMGMLTGTWGLGLIFGPAIGGLLSKPTTAYPHMFNEHNLGHFWYRLLCRYPYLIPNAITAVVSVIVLVLFHFCFKETLVCESKVATNRALQKLPHTGEKMKFNLANLFKNGAGYEKVRENEQDSGVDVMDVELTSVNAEEYQVDVAGNDYSNASAIGKDVSEVPLVEGADVTSTSGWSLLFHNENSNKVQKVLSAYFLLSVVSVMLDETVPLWALSSVAAGGLFYQPSDLGVILSLTGAGLVVFTIGIYPSLSMWLGVDACYSYGLRLMAPFIVSLTVITHILVQHHCGGGIIYAVVVFHIIIIKICTTCSFTSNALLINQSVHKSHRATINGVAMSIGSCAKAIGPFAGALIFAFSIHNSIRFIDFRFLFIILGGITFYASFINFQ